MWELISMLGLGGWIVGAICIMALWHQREVNRQREKEEDAKNAAANIKRDL